MIIHAVDIETTGFSRTSDEILEVGYIRFTEYGKILGSGTFYFYKPEFNIESAAQSVHGLTREMLEPHEKDFEKNLAALYTLMDRALLITKHGKSFDVPFIQSFLAKHQAGVVAPEIRKHVDLEEMLTDEFQQYYVKKYGVQTRKKGTLTELVEMIGLSESELKKEFEEVMCSKRVRAHAALFDAFMTYKLFLYCCKKAAS